MKTEIKLAIAAILLIVSIIVGEHYYAEKHGGDSEKLKQAVEQTKLGEKTLARVDTVYKRDTIRLTREVTKYRSIRDTLKITDTVQVKEFVRQADSTIKACTEVVQTCEQKDSAHRIIEAGLRKQNDALKSLLPTKTERFFTAAKWTLIGAAVGVVYSHR